MKPPQNVRLDMYTVESACFLSWLIPSKSYVLTTSQTISIFCHVNFDEGRGWVKTETKVVNFYLTMTF